VLVLIISGVTVVSFFSGSGSEQVLPVGPGPNILPAGLSGIILSAILAIVMASLASIFNSTATLITMDFYRIFNPEASDQKLVLAGRLSTTLIVILAILWIPVTRVINAEVYVSLQFLQAYIAPPIAAIFIFGLTARSVNGTGAMISLVAGNVIGIIRIILELVHRSYNLDGTIFQWFVGIHFLNFAAVLFLFSSLVLFLSSYLSREPGRIKSEQEMMPEMPGHIVDGSVIKKNVEHHV
jgi:SSS family solute:Na+ symporter